jgi:hypothetical protein
VFGHISDQETTAVTTVSKRLSQNLAALKHARGSRVSLDINVRDNLRQSREELIAFDQLQTIC